MNVLKKIRRAWQGWGYHSCPSHLPRALTVRNRSYSDQTVKDLVRNRDTSATVQHSPQALQHRVLDRQVARRALDLD